MNSITPKKILFISAVLIILSCCTTTSNPRIIDFYGDDNPNDVSKKLLRSIYTSSQTKYFHIIYFNDDTNKTNIFLEGARTSFFFQSFSKNPKLACFPSEAVRCCVFSDNSDSGYDFEKCSKCCEIPIQIH